MEIVSIGLWLAGLFGKQPSLAVARRIGSIAVVLGIVVAVLLAGWFGVRQYRAGVIEQHEQAQSAHDARKALEADRAANEATATQAALAEAENRELEQALADAKRENPEKAKAEVGPVTKSYFDKLRKNK